MGKFRGNIISKDARYNTQNTTRARGVYTLDEQLQFNGNDDWPVGSITFQGAGGNSGFHIPADIHFTDGGLTPNDSTVDFTMWQDDGTDGTFYVDSSPQSGDTGRLYIAVKCNASVPYYSDFCLGGVQFASDDWSQADNGHIYSFADGTDCSAWEQPLVTGLNTANPGYENWEDIINAAGQSWSGVTTGATQAKWNRAGSTGSIRTGAADGISAGFSNNDAGVLFNSNNATIAQTSGASYIYMESSGVQQNMANKWFWLRSPLITLDSEADKRLAIAYHAYTHSSSGMVDSVSNKLIRLWWYTGGED